MDTPNQTENKPNWRDERGFFLPGNPGGPGRPKGQTLKEWVREKLIGMEEQERLAFLKGIPRDVIWRMAEGNPRNDVELSGQVVSKVIKLDE